MEGKKLRCVKEQRRANTVKRSLQTSIVLYRPLHAGKVAFNYQLSIFALPSRLLCPRQSGERQRWTSDIKSGFYAELISNMTSSLFAFSPPTPAEVFTGIHILVNTPDHPKACLLTSGSQSDLSNVVPTHESDLV